MIKYIPTIGLEIHAELKTKTKMFCDSLNDPSEKHPNINVCPICMGFPGTLPVANKKAIESVLKVGLALGGEIPEVSWFERKSYFYPDLPKGYQISQYESPLVSRAQMSMRGEKGELKVVRIRRVHLEEDTGRLIHDSKPRSTLVDFNRAGIPLMELVTEPDISSAYEARVFAQELQLIFRYLGVSDADMEKGQMRVEANVSLQPEDPNSKIQIQNKLGTKVEIKNINSFRSVERAIEYEIERMAELLDGNKEVRQETRGWDEIKQMTVAMRTKEEAEDYRYFPEPDIPRFSLRSKDPLNPDVSDLQSLGRFLPELPEQKRKRFTQEYKIKSDDIEIMVNEPWLAQFYEEAVSELFSWEVVTPAKVVVGTSLPQLASNWLITDVRKILQDEGVSDRAGLGMTPENFAEFLALIAEGSINSATAKKLLDRIVRHNEDPSDVLSGSEIRQISNDDELLQISIKVIQGNSKAVEDFKSGKETVLQFLAGQVMKETKGRANPEIVQRILIEQLRQKGGD